jgi:hypothetical protein
MGAVASSPVIRSDMVVCTLVGRGLESCQSFKEGDVSYLAWEFVVRCSFGALTSVWADLHQFRGHYCLEQAVRKSGHAT